MRIKLSIALVVTNLIDSSRGASPQEEFRVVIPHFPPTSGSKVKVWDPRQPPYQAGGDGSGSIADDPDGIQADLEAFRRIRATYGGGERASSPHQLGSSSRGLFPDGGAPRHGDLDIFGEPFESEESLSSPPRTSSSRWREEGTGDASSPQFGRSPSPVRIGSSQHGGDAENPLATSESSLKLQQQRDKLIKDAAVLLQIGRPREKVESFIQFMKGTVGDIDMNGIVDEAYEQDALPASERPFALDAVQMEFAKTMIMSQRFKRSQIYVILADTLGVSTQQAKDILSCAYIEQGDHKIEILEDTLEVAEGLQLAKQLAYTFGRLNLLERLQEIYNALRDKLTIEDTYMVWLLEVVFQNPIPIESLRFNDAHEDEYQRRLLVKRALTDLRSGMEYDIVRQHISESVALYTGTTIPDIDEIFSLANTQYTAERFDYFVNKACVLLSNGVSDEKVGMEIYPQIRKYLNTSFTLGSIFAAAKSQHTQLIMYAKAVRDDMGKQMALFDKLTRIATSLIQGGENDETVRAYVAKIIGLDLTDEILAIAHGRS